MSAICTQLASTSSSKHVTNKPAKALTAAAPSPDLRNQRQTGSFTVPFVPGARVFRFDFARYYVASTRFCSRGISYAATAYNVAAAQGDATAGLYRRPPFLKLSASAAAPRSAIPFRATDNVLSAVQLLSPFKQTKTCQLCAAHQYYFSALLSKKKGKKHCTLKKTSTVSQYQAPHSMMADSTLCYAVCTLLSQLIAAQVQPL
eukprot:894226-Rhodomonas_salina.6